MSRVRECTTINSGHTISPNQLQRSLIPLPVRKEKCRSNAEIGHNNNVSSTNKRYTSWEAEGESPPIDVKKIVEIKHVQEEQRHIAENLQESERKVDCIKEQLKQVKSKIEEMVREQTLLNDRIAGCEDCGHLLKLAQQKSAEHRSLMRFLELEEQLMGELQRAQRAVCEAGVKGQSFSLQVKKKMCSLYEMYEERKEFCANKRIMRENIIAKNTNEAHKRTLKEVVNSLSSGSKTAQIEARKAKIASIKSARARVQNFIDKTMDERIRKQRKTEAARELKEKLQRGHLLSLKTEIDKQRDILYMQNQQRKMKASKEAAKREARKKEMLLAGENPYLAEKMLENVEKEKKIREKIQKEKEEIEKLSQHMKEINEIKDKEEKKRRKWDNIWARRLKEKRDKEKLKQKQMYGAIDLTLNKTEGKQMHTEQDEETDETELVPENHVEENVGISNFKTNNSKGKKRNATKHKGGSTIDFGQKEVNIQQKGNTVRDTLTSKSNDSIEHSLSQDANADFHLKTPDEYEGEDEAFEEATDFEDSSAFDLELDEFSTEEEEVSDDEYLKKRAPKIKRKKMSKRKEAKVIVHGGSGDSYVIGIERDIVRTILPLGTCFKWNPDIVSFTDFEVGKQYKKKVFVTNLTAELISFAFANLIDSKPKESSNELQYSISQESIYVVGEVPKERSQVIKYEPTITDFVRIDFVQPPPIPSGLQHAFIVYFRPKVLGDWNGTIQFESPKGIFEIPVQCKQKRFIPYTNPANVFFDNVIEGTTVKMALQLKNVGAKSGDIQRVKILSGNDDAKYNSIVRITETSEFSIDADTELVVVAESKNQKPNRKRLVSSRMTALEIPKEAQPIQEESEKSLLSPEIGPKITNTSSLNFCRDIVQKLVQRVAEPAFVAYVKGENRSLEFGITRQINVHFRPTYVGTFNDALEIEFQDPKEEKLIVNLEGHVVENPILAEPLNTTFKICTLDHYYQKVIKISNTNDIIKGSGKVYASVPNALRHYVSVHPKVLTLFQNRPEQISVKFHPKRKLLEDEEIEEFFDKETKIMDFSVKFHLNFPLPVPSPIKATFLSVISDPRLDIDPMSIDLGKCSNIETVMQPISVHNNSMLPQHIAFVDVPEFITIQPNFGFATLLPYETRSFDALVSVPENMEGDHTYNIKCQTLDELEYTITIKLSVKPAIIQLSQPRLLFPAIHCGSVASATVQLISLLPPIKSKSNTFGESMTRFIFKIDDDVPLEVIPSSGFIEPGGNVNILVNYKPSLKHDEIEEQAHKQLENDFITQQGILALELENIMNSIQYEILMEAQRNVEAMNDPGKRSSISSRSQASRRSFEKNKRESQVSKIGKEESGSKLEEGFKEGTNIKNKESIKSPGRSVLDMEKKRHSARRKSTIERRISVKSENSVLKKQSKASLSVIALLEERRDELIHLLEKEYVPPEHIQAEGDEYVRAKLNIMQHKIVPTSKMYTVPCYISDSKGGNTDVILLTAKCAMLSPDLVLIEDSPVMNFGTLVIGHKKVKQFTFANVSNKLLTLKMDIVDPYGPFVQCNALRKMMPYSKFTLKFRYEPTDSSESNEVISVYGGDSKIQLSLKGSGVDGFHFHMDPMDYEVDIGTIEIESVGTHTFTVTNLNEAELIISIELSNYGVSEEVFQFPIEESFVEEDEEEDHITVPDSMLDITAPPNTVVNSEDVPAVDEHHRNHQQHRTEHVGSGTGSASGGKAHGKAQGKSLPKHGSSTSHTSHSRDSHHTIPSTPPPTLGPFVVMQGESSVQYHLRELVQYLKSEEEPVFFQAIPTKFLVHPGESEKFTVYFIPVHAGIYFGKFKVLVFDKVIHAFKVVGTGTPPRKYSDSHPKRLSHHSSHGIHSEPRHSTDSTSPKHFRTHSQEE